MSTLNLKKTVLFTAQTGNTTSEQAIRHEAKIGKPGAIVIDSTAGGAPTVTTNIQGSVDGVNWFNIAYALVATPFTAAVAALTITSTVVTTYLILADQSFKFLRLVNSANNNITMTATAYL